MRPDDGAALGDCLDHAPQPLQFGTSGRRGRVADLTQLEVYLNARAELEYLQSLPAEEGGTVPGDSFYYACDLRPSSTRYVPEAQGRGEIAQAIERAIQDAGMKPVFLGAIPTPALLCYALQRRRGSMMVTGSHIPFDRNGYKTSTARGELRKEDEEPIAHRVAEIRRRLYAQSSLESLFERSGRFKTGARSLPPPSDEAAREYVRRYTDFFAGGSLHGMRLLVYQHSAVGRELLVEILERCGAAVIAAGRTDRFTPIDTENVDDALLATVQTLVEDALARHGPVDAVISTDGDSDRPLLMGVEPGSGLLRFFSGDLVGMIAAEYLRADSVVVPISCSDAIDRGSLRPLLEPKTRIGSPYVIAGMEQALRRGKTAVCGWEANGGFLTGSDIERNERTLKALPTRDAILPLLCVLFSAVERGLSLASLFDTLPRRFVRSALLRDIPRAVGRQIVARFSPADPCIRDALFDGSTVELLDSAGGSLPAGVPERDALERLRAALEHLCAHVPGLGRIARLNYTDGVRVTFESGEVIHARPSGNADELRLYVLADSQERANVLARLGVAEPDGVLRRLEQAACAPETPFLSTASPPVSGYE